MVAPVNKEHANDIERRQPLNRLGFNFNIYPNPTNGSLKINLTSEDNLSNIRIVDVFGKIVYSNESIENENKSIVISLSGLSAGIYFITVGDNNDQFKTKKFVIN